MSGEEEKLYTRAEMLEETGELAQAVAGILAGAQGAGVDPQAVISLTAALQTLDPGASISYSAGSQKDRQDGSGFGSDGEFLEALSDAEDQVREHLREVKEVQEQVVTALDRAQEDLEQGRDDLAAARADLAAACAMPTREPCDGCHSARAAAIAAAEAAPPRPRPGSRTRNAASASARPLPTSSAPSPGDWPGRWRSCGRCLRTSVRSTSWSMSSSAPGGNCRGTGAGSKGRGREADSLPYSNA